MRETITGRSLRVTRASRNNITSAPPLAIIFVITCITRMGYALPQLFQFFLSTLLVGCRADTQYASRITWLSA